ncbi:MAG: hypothetical protein AAGL99_10775 [Pseudomonadota bacterium]
MSKTLHTVSITVAASLIFLGACGAAPTSETEAAESHQTATHDAHDMETLPVEFRVAFMSGHVEAGLSLYRAGAPDQAAKHLLHPVSETHAAERAGIDALGFQQEVFESVSSKLDAGAAASEVETLLQQAEANMALMQAEAGGDTIEIIGFLMDTAEEEYGIGVTDGIITDPGEYQDAYGFAIVALKLAQTLEGDAANDLATELNILTDLWPETGPLADSTPAPSGSVFAQIADVRSALLAF